MRPKYSIITVALNGLHFTSKCIESIFANSKDFELIVVDGNSTDGTAAYLDARAAGVENFKIVSSKQNLTFAENNNLGLQVVDPESQYIVYLNNDTIVSAGWLDQMEAHFTRTPFENVGAVGPVSSSSNGLQMVGKQDPAAWHAEHRGRWKHTGVLYGWCVMVKHEIIKKIGGFDERFENSHEDNDLSLRIQLAGYQLIIAYDTYIDHLGQATLKQHLKSIDEYEQKGKENRERYYDKWWKPEEKKQLVAVYRTAGGDWLERSLAQTSKFADRIALHFCRAKQSFSMVSVGEGAPQQKIYSREEYVDHLKTRFPKIEFVEFYDGIFQEDYERGRLLEVALQMQADGKADWCISVDDDELYEDKFVDKVQAMMNPRNPEVFGYWCNWRTIWSTQLGKEYYRTDSTFGSFTNYRFFRLIPGQKIISFHPEGHHCGSAPWLADECLRWSNIRVKHMGYDTPEQRQKKFEFYEANDHFKTKADIGYDDYSHLISLNPQLQEYVPNNGISLIAMVKNEEHFLLGMLENVEPMVDEFIIVDTGSTDGTLKILEDFKKHSTVPVKILHHAWVDNYSIPRNFAKAHATQRWCMFMDADERFRPQDLHMVFKCSERDLDVVVFNVNNYLEKPKAAGDPLTTAPSQSSRLFRNIPELYFTGIIHETLDDSTMFYKRSYGLKGDMAPVTLHHYGYLKEKSRVREKLDYYEGLNLHQLDVTEEKDPRAYYNLALHWLNDKREHEALDAFQKALKIRPEFYHASYQMAVLNVSNAKHFYVEALKYMPENHPARNSILEIYNFLNEKSRGFVKVA